MVPAGDFDLFAARENRSRAADRRAFSRPFSTTANRSADQRAGCDLARGVAAASLTHRFHALALDGEEDAADVEIGERDRDLGFSGNAAGRFAFEDDAQNFGTSRNDDLAACIEERGLE